MKSLQLLGGLALRLEDPVEAEALLAQPKRVALLVYLALEAPGTWHRRDRIVGLLWPDADQERARNSLRQSLHRLRRALGDGMLERVAPHITLIPPVNVRDDDLGASERGGEGPVGRGMEPSGASAGSACARRSVASIRAASCGVSGAAFSAPMRRSAASSAIACRTVTRATSNSAIRLSIEGSVVPAGQWPSSTR